MKSAVVIHVPHASTVIPAALHDQFALTDEDLAWELRVMTDHFTDVLFHVPDVMSVRCPVSRLILDRMSPAANRSRYHPPMTRPPIDLPLAELAPAPSLFTHPSTLHGPSHVSRVMVHAFQLIAATGWTADAPRLWAAVYLHDLARTHDGVCYRHGGDAMKKFETLPDVRALFARGGVKDDDYPVIHTAVVQHSLPKELDSGHPHWRLTSLLKDADGLDRVRLGDLDPRYLRNTDAHQMVAFAQTLFDTTDGMVPTGDAHFAALWPEAVRLLSAG